MNSVKRTFFLIYIVVSILFFPSMSFAGNSIVECPEIRVYVNGQATIFNDVIIATNGRTLLPLRELLTKLGVQNDDEHIIWNNVEKSVTVFKDSIKIYLKQGSDLAYINEQQIKLDAAPIGYSNGRTYIPTRFVAQALGNRIAWDKYLRRIYIKDENDYLKTQQIIDSAIAKMDSLERFTIFNMSTDEYSITYDEIMVDRKNQIAYHVSSYDSDLLTTEYEAYYQNGVSYICYNKKEGPSGVIADWKKILTPDANFDNEFYSSYYNEIINARDIIYAGLSLTENDENNCYVLKGDVYPVLKYVERNGGYYNDPKIKHIGGALGLAIDRTNLTIAKIEDSYSVEREGNTYKYNNTYLYNNFDGDFSITIPDEVLNAPESEPI